MALSLQSLAYQTEPIPSPIRWIGLVNPLAGEGRAREVSHDVAESGRLELTLLETDVDPAERSRRLRDLIAAKNPSIKSPLGILAFGGGRTTSDVVNATLRYVFPDLNDLLKEEAPERAVDRMLESGIVIGTVRMGAMGNIGFLYGAPRGNLTEVLDYLTEARVTALNLGALFLAGQSQPTIFDHTASAGTLLSPVFESTQGQFGLRRHKRQEWALLRGLLVRKPVWIRWRNADGSTDNRYTLEVFAHAAMRIGGREGLKIPGIGIPGTPQPGLGIKLVTERGLWNLIRIARESIALGHLIDQGDLTPLSPKRRLRSMRGDLQISLDVGEEREFEFLIPHGDSDMPVQVAAAADSDYVGRSDRIRFRALPPWPRFLVRDHSPMARLRQTLS